MTRRETLRLALNALHNQEIELRAPLDEPGIVAVLQKQAKQRRESIDAFEKAGRADLVAKERAELAVIQSYLPTQLGREEIAERAKRVIADVGASSPREQGKVMQRLMPELKGQADGKLVAQVVSELLSEGG